MPFLFLLRGMLWIGLRAWVFGFVLRLWGWGLGFAVLGLRAFGV